jgi:hypothetical protein
LSVKVHARVWWRAGNLCAVRAARDRKRRILERVWIAVGFAYSLFRVFVADATVRKYGVNIAAFAGVEIVSSFPYSIGTARLVTALIDRHYRRAVKWGTIAATCFIAPETFIVATAGRHCSKRRPGHCHGVPTSIYVVIAVILVLFGSFTAWTVRRKVKQAREPDQELPASSDVH